MTQIADKPSLEEVMAHFGTKGMRWGVINKDKPSPKGLAKSPVSASKMASREKRAVKRDVVAYKLNVSINTIKAKPNSNWLVQRSRNSQIADLSKQRDQKIDDAQRIREGKFTKGQKKAIIGASVAAALLVSYGAYKYSDSGVLNQHAIKGKAFISKDTHLWKVKPNLSGPKDADGIMKDVVRQINPDYGKYGTKMNCRRATFAYEMRRRGFDVMATRSHGGTGQTPASLLNATDPKSHIPTGTLGQVSRIMMDEVKKRPSPLKDSLDISRWGKNPIDIPIIGTDIDGSATSRRIFTALSKQPDGARGELGVGWHMGGGHSMAWEIIGGKPTIFDAQSGERYLDGSFRKLAKNIGEAGITRLDNVDLNQDFLLRWLKDAA